MSAVKDRIAAIDEFGRELAGRVNEMIVADDLKGQSPATVRRVEELIEEVVEGARPDGEPNPWEFTIMKGGLASAPLVTIARYNGRVGS